jgi:hypothetical protein
LKGKIPWLILRTCGSVRPLIADISTTLIKGTERGTFLLEPDLKIYQRIGNALYAEPGSTSSSHLHRFTLESINLLIIFIYL